MKLSIKGLFETLSIMTPSVTTLCHYAECSGDECRILFIAMPRVIMLSVAMVNVIMLSVMEP